MTSGVARALLDAINRQVTELGKGGSRIIEDLSGQLQTEIHENVPAVIVGRGLTAIHTYLLSLLPEAQKSFYTMPG